MEVGRDAFKANIAYDPLVTLSGLQHASVTAAVQRHCSVCVLSHGRGLVAGLQNTAAACRQHCRNCTHLQISLQNTPAAAPSVSPTLHCTHFALLQNLQTLVTSAGCSSQVLPA